jgi:hypothetical protein
MRYIIIARRDSRRTIRESPASFGAKLDQLRKQTSATCTVDRSRPVLFPVVLCRVCAVSAMPCCFYRFVPTVRSGSLGPDSGSTGSWSRNQQEQHGIADTHQNGTRRSLHDQETTPMLRSTCARSLIEAGLRFCAKTGR